MGLFDKFKQIFSNSSKKELDAYEEGLQKTSKEFVNKINILNSKYKKVSNEYFEELEEIFIMADIGVDTVMTFIDKLKRRVKSENIVDSKDLMDIIIDEMFIIYVNNDIIVNKINYQETNPTVILFVGVNGVGKTTSIGKIAYRLKNQGKKVLLVAGDTFRAGAIEQINEWGSRVGCDVVSKETQDASSVIYDGLTKELMFKLHQNSNYIPYSAYIFIILKYWKYAILSMLTTGKKKYRYNSKKEYWYQKKSICKKLSAFHI